MHIARGIWVTRPERRRAPDTAGNMFVRSRWRHSPSISIPYCPARRESQQGQPFRALRAVAGLAREYNVLDCIRPAVDDGNDMVNGAGPGRQFAGTVRADAPITDMLDPVPKRLDLLGGQRRFNALFPGAAAAALSSGYLRVGFLIRLPLLRVGRVLRRVGRP